MSPTSTQKDTVQSFYGDTFLTFFFLVFSVGVIALYVYAPSIFIRLFGIYPDTQWGILIMTAALIVAIAGPMILSIRIFLSAKQGRSIIFRLQETRDRYARVLEGSGAGTWERDARKKTVYVSTHWKTLFGYTDDTAPRTEDEWFAIIVDEDRLSAKETYHHAVETNMHTYKSSYRIRTGTGAIRYVTDEATIERNAGRDEIIISGSTRDVTAIHEAEALLKKRTAELRAANDRIREEMLNTRKFALAVSAAGDGIVITDSEGTLVYANDAWYTLTGMPNITDTPTKIFSPFEEHSPAEEMRAMRMAFRSGSSYTSDALRGIRAGNDMYDIELSLVPVTDENKTVFYSAIVIDATKRKAIDKAKTEFVSVASHQLKTPLAAVKWYVEMLVSETAEAPDKPIYMYAKEIENANKRMIELVDSLLDISRIDLGTMVWDPALISLSSVVSQVLSELRPLSDKKHLSISTQDDTKNKELHFDQKQLSIIFQNILSNAIRYTPEGGHIEIVLRPEGDNLFFSVKDNGCGIPIAQQSRIFGKMFRADNAKDIDPSGNGLGLYTVKQIIERVGGSIRFESEVGTGTTFYGILPTHPEMIPVTNL